MPIIGPNFGVSGPGKVGPEVSRADKRARGRAVKEKDEVIAGADSVELDRAVQDLKSNDQEESREDHQQGGAYTQRGTRAKDDEPPRLDVAG